jgi:hypothetical protein
MIEDAAEEISKTDYDEEKISDGDDEDVVKIASWEDTAGTGTSQAEKNPGKKHKKDRPDMKPWKDNGIEVMLQAVEHMPHEYKRNLFFFGPKTEWKENISGEYLFRPKAFNDDDDEPSLKGHYNGNNESLYPKLIKSLNQAKEYTFQTFLEYSGEDPSKIKITREGKSIYLHGSFRKENVWSSTTEKIVKKPIKLYTKGPVTSILLLHFLHQQEGKKMKAFVLREGDQPMKILGWSPARAERWYDERGAK